MKSFHEEERICALTFESIGECYHLWTPENFEIIFTCDSDFQIGMNIIAICAKLYPDIRIVTFEWMANHLHMVLAGQESRIRSLLNTLKRFLARYFQANGRSIDWSHFTPGLRRISSLEDMRNVIIYDNMNGYEISPGHTPFSYPWGANRYFFNPDACRLAMSQSRKMSLRERQSSTRSRSADYVSDILMFDGYALPLSFCDIETGQRLFRNPSHYFSKVSRSVETDKTIAKEIGENIYYTDSDLFAAVSKACRERYGFPSPGQIPSEAKMEIAKMMRFEYNASVKQIQRMLKLGPDTIQALGFNPK
mgnify:CR=1 FL=1